VRLSELQVGHKATVQSVGGDGSFRRRLLELGFTPGIEIERTKQTVGDVHAYRVRNAIICLRNNDASDIIVL
jgi:Fe2+ transport system protein FeoA